MEGAVFVAAPLLPDDVCVFVPGFGFSLYPSYRFGSQSSIDIPKGHMSSGRHIDFVPVPAL